MDFVLALLVLSMWPLALCALVVPHVVLITCRRRVLPAASAYLATLSMLAVRVAALNADMDWADRTGSQGSALAGAGWFLGAMAAAATATVVPLRRCGTRRVA